LNYLLEATKSRAWDWVYGFASILLVDMVGASLLRMLLAEALNLLSSSPSLLIELLVISS
jgi:hypothetical protein